MRGTIKIVLAVVVIVCGALLLFGARVSGVDLAAIGLIAAGTSLLL